MANPTPTTAETMKLKMDEIWLQFQAVLQSEVWKDFVNTAQRNIEEMKKLAANGQQDLLKQLKKKNDEIVEQMKKTQAETREKLRTDFNQIKTQAGEERERKLAEFKRNYEASLKKVADESSKAYQSSIKELNDFKGKTNEDYDKFFKVLEKNLETNYNNVLEKLKF